MIFMGCIARNLFGPFMDAYPNQWAAYMRSCIIGMILGRGGLTVSFRGKGLIVILLSILPTLVESTVAAFIAHGVFDMPIEVGYSFAYSYTGVATAIIIPLLMGFNEQGYGKKAGIIPSLSAAGVFCPIICIISYGISKAIAF